MCNPVHLCISTIIMYVNSSVNAILYLIYCTVCIIPCINQCIAGVLRVSLTVHTGCSYSRCAVQCRMYQETAYEAEEQTLMIHVVVAYVEVCDIHVSQKYTCKSKILRRSTGGRSKKMGREQDYFTCGFRFCLRTFTSYYTCLFLIDNLEIDIQAN